MSLQEFDVGKLSIKHTFLYSKSTDALTVTLDTTPNDHLGVRILFNTFSVAFRRRMYSAWSERYLSD